MSAWLEITTAPKDGTPIEVGWLSEKGELEYGPVTTRWQSRPITARRRFGEWEGQWTPTHWRKRKVD